MIEYTTVITGVEINIVMAPRLDTVLIKTASRCNLDCSYCYVYQGKDTSWKQQPKRLSVKTIDVIVNRLFEQSQKQKEGFAIVLHGGEPLLLGYERLSLFLEKLRSKLSSELYPISLQTNGVLLNSKLLDLFSKTVVSVSVSLDGEQATNDISRVDHLGKSTYEKTIAGIKLLKSHRDSNFLFAGTLSVIQVSRSPKKTYESLKELNTPSMDFLLQDGNYEKLPVGKKDFNSTEYGKWLSGLLDVYLSEPKPVEIPYLDDLIKLCLGGVSSKEGRGSDVFGILIIETNGEIRKNDTLRTAFDGADFFQHRKNILETPISDILQTSEFHRSSQLQFPTAQVCKKCSLLEICGGGMPLYRWDSKNEYDNPSIYCKDHELLIKNIFKKLALIPCSLK